MAKKHKHPEHENLERWLVSFADFMTLLFALFVVLYALGQTDKSKYQNAIENIQRSFLNAGGIFPLHGSPFVPFDKPADKGSQAPPSPTETGAFSKANPEAVKAETQKIAEQVHGLFERTTGVSLSPGQVEVIRTAEGYKIRLGEYLLFRPGSDKLRRENIPFLFELGKRLNRLEIPVTVEGHSDASPAVNSHTNWQLSISRAYNVVNFLVEAVDFSQDKISLTGYGSTRPIARNDTVEGRGRNRRIEFSILSPNKDLPEMQW